MFSQKLGLPLLIAAAIASLAAAGCSHEVSRADVDKKRDQAQESERKAAAAESSAVQDRRDANQLEAKEKEQETKKDFVAKMQSNLLVVDGRIKDLDNRRSELTDTARKNEWTARIKQLRAERSALDKKVDDVKSSTGADWLGDRTNVIGAWDEFSGHLVQAERDMAQH